MSNVRIAKLNHPSSEVVGYIMQPNGYSPVGFKVTPDFKRKKFTIEIDMPDQDEESGYGDFSNHYREVAHLVEHIEDEIAMFYERS